VRYGRLGNSPACPECAMPTTGLRDQVFAVRSRSTFAGYGQHIIAEPCGCRVTSDEAGRELMRGAAAHKIHD